MITVSLITVDLDDAPPYLALSYVWGEDVGTAVYVQCANHDVRNNRGLFDALSNIQSQTNERLIWADAICIDQRDIEERAAQVSIMDKIFEGAESVVVYLGKATEHTEQAFRILGHLTNMNEVKDELPWSDAHLSETEKSL
jgi:hypothetical protein